MHKLYKHLDGVLGGVELVRRLEPMVLDCGIDGVVDGMGGGECHELTL